MSVSIEVNTEFCYSVDIVRRSKGDSPAVQYAIEYDRPTHFLRQLEEAKTDAELTEEEQTAKQAAKQRAKQTLATILHHDVQRTSLQNGVLNAF